MKWRRLGDTVLWTSALQALRQMYPNAEIDLAYAAEYDCLFSSTSDYRTRYQLKSDATHLKQLVREWKTREYDLALCFHASATTRGLASKINAKRKIIHHHSRQPNAFGSDVPVANLGKPMAATERDLNVVRTLGWTGNSPNTHLELSPDAKTRAQRAFEKKTGHPAKKLILLAPGASRLAKRWPLDYYVRLLDTLPKEATVATIAANETEFLDRQDVMEILQERAPIFYTPQLEDALGLISLADCFVGSDSGLKHIAAALGVATVTMFGPESVGEWHPYSEDKHTALQVPVGCRSNDAADPLFSWCGVETCPLASHACLTQISPEQVSKAIERYL